MNTKTRLLDFVDFKSISKREFCKKSLLSHTIFNNNSAIGSDKLEKIHNAYEELNMDWVITGRGEMIYKNNSDMENKIDETFEVAWKEIPIFINAYMQLAVKNGWSTDDTNPYYIYDPENYNSFIHKRFFQWESEGKSPDDHYKLIPVMKRFCDMFYLSGVDKSFTKKMLNIFIENAYDLYYEAKTAIAKKQQKIN